MVTTRLITKDDVEALTAMFKEHDADSPALSLCSGTGCLVEEDGVILGCSFLYLTNSPVSLIDLSCVRKGIDKAKRDEVIDAFIEKLKDMALGYGYKFICCDPIHKRSDKRLLDHGFYLEEKTNSYWYEVQ